MENKAATGFYVYILKCSDGSYYTGYTANIFARMQSHARGQQNIYTSSRRPLKLVFYRAYPTKYEALRVEKKIKGWSHKKKVALITNDFLMLQALGGNKFSTLSILDKESAKQIPYSSSDEEY